MLELEHEVDSLARENARLAGRLQSQHNLHEAVLGEVYFLEAIVDAMCVDIDDGHPEIYSLKYGVAECAEYDNANGHARVLDSLNFEDLDSTRERMPFHVAETANGISRDARHAEGSPEKGQDVVKRSQDCCADILREILRRLERVRRRVAAKFGGMMRSDSTRGTERFSHENGNSLSLTRKTEANRDAQLR
jgi:hypothetical protein